jgi:hypothetical protein
MKVQADHDFKYKAPAKEELYQRAVRSLANMQCPNFDDVDNSTTMIAFEDGLGEGEDEYFEKLRDDVAKASSAKTQLVEDEAKDHHMTRGCFDEKCAHVTDGISKMEITFTPGLINPFVCEKRDLVVKAKETAGDSKKVIQDTVVKDTGSEEEKISAPAKDIKKEALTK